MCPDESGDVNVGRDGNAVNYSTTFIVIVLLQITLDSLAL